jgi:hypothetical protein
MTTKHAAFSLILIGLSGCASGPSPQPGLPDSLTALINNDSTGTMLMRGASMHTFANARCEGGERQANKMSMANEEALTTIPVKPGLPLTFALTTLNAQSFKGNWGCSATSTFTPVAGARYEATLQTESDNLTCKLTILDQDKQPVAATEPDYSCPKTLAGVVKNGQRYVAKPVPIYISVPR